VQYVVDVNSLGQKQEPTLGLNSIGLVSLELDRAISFDPYRQNRETGSFILIDRYTNATVAAGMVVSGPVASDSLPEAGFVSEIPGSGNGEPVHVGLNAGSVSAAGIIDLSAYGTALAFDVSPCFIDHLGKGNRILFRLGDLGQLQAVAQLAYVHRLTFEFDRLPEGAGILLYRRGIRPAGGLYADDGTGI
jgi:sulfate adenylyltransferase subunit 1